MDVFSQKHKLPEGLFFLAPVDDEEKAYQEVHSLGVAHSRKIQTYRLQHTQKSLLAETLLVGAFAEKLQLRKRPM